MEFEGKLGRFRICFSLVLEALLLGIALTERLTLNGAF